MPKETSQSNTDDLIKVITGTEEITNFVLQGYQRTRVKLDSCLDFIGPSVVDTDYRVMKAASEMINRGIKIRLITDITKENINYCKDLSKVSEIRHISGIKGNFGILDEKEYLIHLIHKESEAPSQIIYNNDSASTKAQQSLFNILWKNAIPIEDRIREIEYGIRLGFIDTVREPEEIEKIYLNMIVSASKELLLLFPTVNAFYRLERKELMSLLYKNAEKGVQIRILTPMDDPLKEQSKICNSKFDQIEMNPITEPLDINSTIVVSDNKYSLIMETKDDNKYNFNEANGLAVYSNSVSSVWTHTTIFENLWMRSNLYA